MTNMMKKFLKKPLNEPAGSAKPLNAPRSVPKSRSVEPSLSSDTGITESPELSGSTTRQQSSAPSKTSTKAQLQGTRDEIINRAAEEAKRTVQNQTEHDLVVSEAPTAESPSLLGEGLRIEGELHASESLTVLGEISGAIRHEGELLTIGASGRIDASIHSQNLLVEGRVTGDIYCSESVAITAGANVTGNIKTKRLSIADGAQFSGKIDMG